VMLGSTVMLASIIVPAMGGNAVSNHCFGLVVACFHT